MARADIFADCRWCRGYGRQDTGCRDAVGPCQFCTGERDKAARREQERRLQTGEYKDPEFERYFGPTVYYDLKSQTSHVLRTEIAEI